VQSKALFPWFDMRELGQVLAHVHDADIEIGWAR
jgi:hypothetical protein